MCVCACVRVCVCVCVCVCNELVSTHLLCICTTTECGGKMHLREGEFSLAHTDFFEAFKNYDEAGSPRCVSPSW